MSETTTSTRYRRRYLAHPIRQTLRFDGVLIGCTDTSFAMGVDHSTLGAMIVTEKQVRGLSTEKNPDPKSPGLNLDQLEGVAARLRIDFTNRSGDHWPALIAELDDNAAVVAQLWYGAIGGGNIGHAFYLRSHLNGRVTGVDPVKGVYRSWTDAQVQHAMKVFADRTGLADGLRWGAFRRSPFIHLNQAPHP